MLKNDKRCINVKSAVDLITTTDNHPYALRNCLLHRRDLFGSQGILNVYLTMISRCFVRQSYFLDRINNLCDASANKISEPTKNINNLFFNVLTKASLSLRDEWQKHFGQRCASINWEKFCTDGIMEINMVSLSLSNDHVTTTSRDETESTVLKGMMSVPAEGNTFASSRHLDSAFNHFHATCNRRLNDIIIELERLLTTDESSENEIAPIEVPSILKRSVSFDDARVICLAFRDMYHLEALMDKLRQAKAILEIGDPCHLIEYERHIHALFITRLDAYSRLMVRYNGNTRVRDWSYVSEFFFGVHARAIERYDKAALVSSVFRGMTLSGMAVDQLNRDLLTLHVSLLHRQVRVFFVHDLVMRYLVRRYFTKTCNPKFTVHPFEKRDELDDERIRFFVWLVNRCLVNDACYEWHNAMDDAEFWRRVLAHCASLSPSTFVAQLFKYVASLDARVPVNVHDLLDYVEWLCAYDPWYMCYSNSIIERFRLFSENKLQKQFSAFYESECLLFYVLVGNRLSSVDEKIKFLRERPELRAFARIDDACHRNTVFNYSRHVSDDRPLPSTTIPIFNWFNLSSNVFNYGVYYETLDWCAKTVQDYFSFAQGEMKKVSRQSSTSSLSTIGDVHCNHTAASDMHSASRKRPFSSLAIPRDSLIEMIARSSGAKHPRCNDDNRSTLGIDNARIPVSQYDDISRSHTADYRDDNSHDEINVSIYPRVSGSSGESSNDAVSMQGLQRFPHNKSFVVSLLQNCMNFLNDICLMYNGNLIHKCCAENKHSYNQSSFKDRLKHSNDVWKNDKRLVVYHITWKDLDLHKLEESCYREKSEERVSKAIGNTLASRSTSQINVNYLRFRNDGKHSYVIFNAMLRRYEIAAPSLMYLLSLDYKNWHLSDNDCYPSSVDPCVRDYVSIALNEMDSFVDAVVRIDALSMMLNSDLIREKRIAANSAVTRLDRHTGPRYANKRGDNSNNQNDVSKDPVSATPNFSTVANDGGDDMIAMTRNSDENDINVNAGDEVPKWDNVTPLGDIGEDKSYVDFTLDRAEFFELSQTISPQWIYRYFERSLCENRDCTFVHIVLLIVQTIHHYGMGVLDRESFSSMVIDELLLCRLSRDDLLKLRMGKKTSLNGESRQRADISASHSARDHSSAAIETGNYAGNRVYAKRCDLSLFLENQFQTCLALSDQVMNRYRSSYRREPTQLSSSPYPLASSECNTRNDESTITARDEKKWHETFKQMDDERRTTYDSTRNSSIVRDLLVEQDMRHFFATTLHSTEFYRWLTSRHAQVKLADVIDLGDNAFVRIFAAFVYAIRVIVRQQSHAAINEEEETNSGDVQLSSLAGHITRNARRIFHELRLMFPCRFVASRSTINLSDAFVDYLERRIMTVVDYRTRKGQDNLHNMTAAANMAMCPDMNDGTHQNDSHDEDNDPFSSLLCSLNNENDFPSGNISLCSNQNIDGHPDDLTVRNVPYLRESSLSYKTRQSISYFLFFIYIFCNCDISVTLYMLRFLASFLYPGPWAKTVAIVQGSSNSGKSNMFNLVRSFYNSDMAVLNPRALTGPKDNIGTEFLLMCENFVCQTEELKEVEAETIKTMTSDTPLQARSFHSQRQQTVGILASMVITLNQMFRVVSDEGVLERLRVIFRVTHRHLELVRKESDMTRVNCGASMNISHQFIRSIFPRGIVPELFQRGMFFTMMNWCSSQVTSPEDRFIHADRVASRYLHTLLHADVPSLQSVHEFAAERNFSDLDISRELARRWQESCVMQESCQLPENLSSSMKKIMEQMDKRFTPMSQPNTSAELLNHVFEPTSRNMIERYLLHVSSFKGLLGMTQARLEMRMSYARQYTNCVRSHELYSRLFSKIRNHYDLISYVTHTLSDSHRASAHVGSIVEQIPLPCVNDDEYDDNHVNLMVKPYILDLYLADLHANIDSFVRFQNTHKVTSSESPISKEILQYQLKVFVDRFNATIPDAKYRVKFNEFFDRFETEYERFKYRDTRTNQIIPNLWAIHVRQLIAN